ncbi:class E sortase [Beutenbergia cavernae]|nr:class E sortase [Beutenbergia cavernae]
MEPAVPDGEHANAHVPRPGHAAAAGRTRARRWLTAAAGVVVAGALLAGCAPAARELATVPAPASSPPQTLPTLPAEEPTPELAAEAPQVEGATFATLTVPRFGADWSVPVHEGITDPILDRDGVGHFPDSALAGEVGNFALAGHRTLSFAPLYDIDLLAVGDEIVVTTETGRYTYAVSSSEIVTPDAMRVVGPDPQNPGAPATQAILTLVACHPKGSVEFRWITYATLVGSEPLTGGASG